MKALTIGGTKGFGRYISECLEKEGYEIITVGRSKEGYKDYEHFVCDIGNLKGWKETLRKIKKDNRNIDLIACIVGFARAKRFRELLEEDWSEHFIKNLFYVSLTFQELNPTKAITIGSQWSYKIGCDELVPYTIAKHALATLTEDIAIRNKNLIINHYCVPTMNTPQYKEVKESFIRLGQEKKITGFQKGVIANPEKVANELIDFALKTKKSGKMYVLDKNGNLPNHNSF